MSTPDKGESLSAVIPIWNYSRHKQNIQAILFDLSKYRIEVILILDSEPSESFSELEALVVRLKLKGKVVQVIAGNPGDSRNEGKKWATREWITFWDCDDVPIIETYLYMITTAKKENSQLAIAGYRNEKEKECLVIDHGIEIKNTGAHIALNPGIWRMVFQSKFIQNIDFPSLRMGEDQVFFARALNSNPSITVLHEYAYVYRTGNKDQLTSSSIFKREILIAYYTLLKEKKKSHRHVKIVSTMLLRQELSILTQREIKFLVKVKVGLKFIVRSISNVDTLLLIIKYKISEARKKRTFF